MAKGGRQPKPDLKLLTKPTGSKPKDRSRSARSTGGVPVDTDPLHGEVPDPPRDIRSGTEGRRYWRLYWQAAGEWLVKADYPVVVRLCRLHNIAERLMKGINDEGLYEDGKAHRMLRDYDMVISRVERLEDRLGLNPVERARIRITPKEKETALDRWSTGRGTGSP